MLEIRNSYDKIAKKVHDGKINGENFYNKNVNSYIENKFLILKNDISSCDKKNKEKLKEIVELITELECLLKMTVSFPRALEQSILNNLNAAVTNKKEVIEKIETITNQKAIGLNYVTEASFLPDKNIIILGPGPITAHQKDERIQKESFKKCQEIYRKIILEQ